MKWNNCALKPILKQELGDREIDFYQSINSSSDPFLMEIRDLVPKFFGRRTVSVDGRQVECLVLEDLCRNYREPCVMDIKIGRRTWGPDSSRNKIVSEEMKYQGSKRDLALCIPGFQFFDLATNKCRKFDKTYGKQLDGEGVKEAIRMFLNLDTGVCRSLIVQILASLWRVQHWARNQRDLRLYSTSILILYDARRLRELIRTSSRVGGAKLARKNSLYRPLSLAVLNNQPEKIPTGFSGQLTQDGPILRSPTTPNKIIDFSMQLPKVNNNNVWQKSMRTLQRTHSFQNNYDKDLQNRKLNYTYVLDELCRDEVIENSWATVKMIDFAHTHHRNNCDIDRNYLEGVENLVRIFEEFLIDTE